MPSQLWSTARGLKCRDFGELSAFLVPSLKHYNTRQSSNNSTLPERGDHALTCYVVATRVYFPFLKSLTTNPTY